MFKINSNFLKIEEQYLFSEINQIKKNLKNSNKENSDSENSNKIIDMSIGDVSLPLSEDVIIALHNAVDDMANSKNFKGYSPSQGYLFLRKAIKNKYHKINNIEIDLEDIFINDGAKSDLSNILDIFSKDNIVGIQSVCYPVYLDVCKMNGIKTVSIRSDKKNNFLPMPKDIDNTCQKTPDLIYLCSPNNPTGMAYNKEQLEIWINFAIKNNIIIFYDSAYQDFITQENIPKTIYEIKDAQKCAIEICSFSKSAGFTGIRCGYTIVPSEIKTFESNKEIVINKLWQRRQVTKFNGVSYLSQKAAESFINNHSQRHIEHCQNNLQKIKQFLDEKNLSYWGGINSPYIWLKCPDNMNSKNYFKYLIDQYKIVSTPGIGFGEDGEGFIRISTFFNINFDTK